MEKKRLIWIAAIVCVVLIIIFLPGISRYHRLKARWAKLDNAINKLRRSETGLMKEQDKLQKDPIYIEKVARDKLQIANKGETIVRVEKRNAK